MRAAIVPVRLLGNAVTGLGRRLFSLQGAFLAAVAGGGLVYLIRQSFKAIDALAKVSDRLQIDIQALAGMRHAADLAGVSIESFDGAISIMVRELGKAQLGTGEAVRGLRLLGMSAGDLIRAGPEEAFKRIAEGIKGLGDSARQAAAASYFFGRSGMDLVTVLKGGRADMDLWIARAKEMGAVTREQAARVEAANDAFTTLRFQLTLITGQIAAELAPYLKVLADDLTGVANVGGAVGKAFEYALSGTIEWVGKLQQSLNFIFVQWLRLKTAVLDYAHLVAWYLGSESEKRLHDQWKQAQADLAAAMAPAAPNAGAVSDWFAGFLRRVKEAKAAAAAMGRDVAKEMVVPFEDIGDALAKAAERWRERLRSPIEKFGDMLRELRQLAEAGLLTGAEFARGRAVALQELLRGNQAKALAYKPVAATIYGSAADISARARLAVPREAGGVEAIWQRMLEQDRKGLVIDDDQLQLLGRIEKHLEAIRKNEWAL